MGITPPKTVDYIALSFVRTAADIRNIKEFINQENKNTPVIAKIEKHEAIDHYEDILDAAANFYNDLLMSYAEQAEFKSRGHRCANTI